MAKEVTNESGTETVHAPTHASGTTDATAAIVVPKGPRSYLVMMLLAVIALPTGLARAYRGEAIGWTRFWIYVGATVGCIIPLLNILAGLALIALSVWGAIDVFQLYKTKTDAEGEALTTTPRDEKFAHAFYIYFLVCLILTGIGLLVALVFGAFILNAVFNNPNGFSNFERQYDTSQNSPYQPSYDTQYR